MDNGLSKLPTDDVDMSKYPPYQGTPQEHRRLLETARTALQVIAADSPLFDQASKPMLYHPDLNKRNVFVSQDDPRTVSTFIDWQSAFIAPAFEHAWGRPDFAGLSEEESQDNKVAMKNVKLYKKSVDICQANGSSCFAAAFELDASLLKILRFCDHTWSHGIAYLHHELIELTDSWDEVKFSGECPIPSFPESERRIHADRYFKTTLSQQIREWLPKFLPVSVSGEVPSERWEEVLGSYKGVYQYFVEAMQNPADPDTKPIPEAEFKRLWPYDLELLNFDNNVTKG